MTFLFRLRRAAVLGLVTAAFSACSGTAGDTDGGGGADGAAGSGGTGGAGGAAGAGGAGGSGGAGSVTIGGCVDAQVIEESEDVLATMRPRLLELNLGDEEAWEIGLTCGGTSPITKSETSMP